MKFKDYKKNQCTVEKLYENKCAKISEISKSSGIYMLEFPDDKSTIDFNESSKDKDNKYSIENLKEKFNKGNGKIVYIGKATSKKGGLRKRLGDYIKYAYGKNVSHRGGRAVWQIQGWEKLKVYWYPMHDADAAKDLEAKLQIKYKKNNKTLPLANWREEKIKAK